MDNVVVATFFTVNVVDAEILRSPPTAKEVARPVGVLVAIPTEFVVLKVPITVEDALEINPPVPTPLGADSPNLERPVTLNAAPAVEDADDIKPESNVERPSALNVPPTRNVVPTLEEAFETNPAIVERPETSKVLLSVDAPETVSAPPVVILVLMVVAAYPTNATAKTDTTTEKNTEIYFCIN